MKEKIESTYNTGLEEYDTLIKKLAELCALPENKTLIQEILTTAVKLGLEKADHGDLKLINSALKELRYSFKVFSLYRNVRKVAIFGSTRTKKESPEYKLAEEFARKIVTHGFMVITGAGSGIMEAANKGAGKDKSFGVNIRLPFGQKPNPYIANNDSKLINFKYFFTRKLIFIKESNATVLFPGGFGTNDEGFETLTLFQTGKTLPRPIILIEPKGFGYWEKYLEFLHKGVLHNKYILENDLKLLRLVSEADAAVEEIVRFYRVYHSLRYIGDLTVLRLNCMLSENKIRDLKEGFQDILLDRNIEQRGALEEEIQNGEYPDLPRLVLRFDKKSFGRLREMIDMINTD